LENLDDKEEKQGIIKK